jgi:hypothetical protein
MRGHAENFDITVLVFTGIYVTSDIKEFVQRNSDFGGIIMPN